MPPFLITFKSHLEKSFLSDVCKIIASYLKILGFTMMNLSVYIFCYLSYRNTCFVNRLKKK